MIVFDGNDSAKRMDLREFRQQGDMRQFQSNYYIPREEVDQWALSKVRALPRGPEVPAPEDDGLWEDDDDTPFVAHTVELEEEEPQAVRDPEPDAQKAQIAEVAECVNNWKAAQSDSRKRVVGMFDETGWFACGCRHGLILWVADMVRSGEQYVDLHLDMGIFLTMTLGPSIL